MNFFQQKIRPKFKTKKQALKHYLRTIVIYQSRNKNNSNWNEKRRSCINMTYRQIKERTCLSLGLISQTINEMYEDGTIKVFIRKKSLQRKHNDMVFYYFVDIFEAMVKSKAFKIVKKKIEIINNSRKMNTRNINYINKLSYKTFLADLIKKQLKDFYTQWDFEKEKWVREARSNFTLTKDEKDNLFSSMWKILNA